MENELVFHYSADIIALLHLQVMLIVMSIGLVVLMGGKYNKSNKFANYRILCLQ